MGYQDIQPQALEEILGLSGITVIDQRDDASRQSGELPGALAPSDALMTRLIRQRRQNLPVLVYCYHGNQSRDLCLFLVQLGLTQVYNLVGGWDAWTKWKTA